MTHRFDDATLAGVLRHMNDDHSDDNVLIARAFGTEADVIGARMTDFDGDGGDWVAEISGGTSVPVRASWPGGPISERAEVRREIVALYDEACRRLGLEPRAHA